MPTLTIVQLIDPLDYFETDEDAEKFMAWGIEATRMLGMEFEHEIGRSASSLGLAIAVIERYFPDLSWAATRTLASAIAFQVDHALDQPKGNA